MRVAALIDAALCHPHNYPGEPSYTFTTDPKTFFQVFRYRQSRLKGAFYKIPVGSDLQDGFVIDTFYLIIFTAEPKVELLAVFELEITEKDVIVKSKRFIF